MNDTAPADTLSTPESAPETLEAPETSWRDSLSDDYKGKYEEFKDPNSLMKSYDSLVKKMGKDPIVKPSEGASEDEIKAYKQTLAKELGASDDAGAYEVDLSEAPEFVQQSLSEDALSEYKQLAIEQGMTPDQFKGIIGKYVENQQKELDSLRESTQAHYKEQWGDEYDANIKGATEFAKKVAPDLLGDPILGNHPTVIKLMHELNKNFGDKMGEGDVATFAKNDSGAGDLEARRQELLKKALDANISIDDRRRAVEQASEIYRKLKG